MGGSNGRAVSVKPSLYYHGKKTSTIQALHGFGGDGEDFVLVQTASNFDWCAMDLLGHGASPKSMNPDDYTVQSQAEMVSSQVHGEIVLGYSMGARLALQAVLQYPSIWKGLILISGTAGLQEGRSKRQAWDQALADRLQTSTRTDFWQYWSQVPIIQSQSRIEEEFRIQREKRRQKTDLNSLAASVLGFGAGIMPSVWHRLHEVRVPVLLIVGEEDQKYQVLAKKLDKEFLDSQLHVVANAGHAPHMEQPTMVANIIDGWINTLHR